MRSWLSRAVAPAWALLFAAGLLEAGSAVGTKSTLGFTRWSTSDVVLIPAPALLAVLGPADLAGRHRTGHPCPRCDPSRLGNGSSQRARSVHTRPRIVRAALRAIRHPMRMFE
jgi:hypothetical protein